MNFFKKLFGSQNTSKEVKEEKNFDVLKYDGVRYACSNSIMRQNASCSLSN